MKEYIYEDNLKEIESKVSRADQIIQTQRKKADDLFAKVTPGDIEATKLATRACLGIDENKKALAWADQIVRFYKPLAKKFRMIYDYFLKHGGDQEITVLEIKMEGRVLKLKIKGENIKIIKTDSEEEDVRVKDMAYMAAALNSVLKMGGVLESSIFAIIHGGLPHITVSLNSGGVKIPERIY